MTRSYVNKTLENIMLVIIFSVISAVIVYSTQNYNNGLLIEDILIFSTISQPWIASFEIGLFMGLIMIFSISVGTKYSQILFDSKGLMHMVDMCLIGVPLTFVLSLSLFLTSEIFLIYGSTIFVLWSMIYYFVRPFMIKKFDITQKENYT